MAAGDLEFLAKMVSDPDSLVRPENVVRKLGMKPLRDTTFVGFPRIVRGVSRNDEIEEAL